MISSKDDLVTSRANGDIVAKYTGNLEDDDLWIDDYGTNEIYYRWNGIRENGDLNRVDGFTCLYYFFDNKADYEAGLAKVKSYNLRGTNADCYYFTVSTTDIDGETFDEVVALFNEGGDYTHPNFYLVD